MFTRASVNGNGDTSQGSREDLTDCFTVPSSAQHSVFDTKTLAAVKQSILGNLYFSETIALVLESISIPTRQNHSRRLEHAENTYSFLILSTTWRQITIHPLQSAPSPIFSLTPKPTLSLPATVPRCRPHQQQTLIRRCLRARCPKSLSSLPSQACLHPLWTSNT